MSRHFLTASWETLVMLNFEIDPSILRPIVPMGTELDCWKGKCLVSVVGFLFLNTRVLGFSVPFHRNFEEVNLRFYVRRKVDGNWRRGVVFIKEFVPRIAIAKIARWLYNENYVALRMGSNICLPDDASAVSGSAEYSWISGSRKNIVSAEFRGLPRLPERDSEEEFITEHYWGYVAQRDGTCLEYQVEHPPWRVWSPASGVLDCDIRSLYGEQYVDALGRPPTSAFVAEGSSIAVVASRGP